MSVGSGYLFCHPLEELDNMGQDHVATLGNLAVIESRKGCEFRSGDLFRCPTGAVEESVGLSGV